MAHSRRPGLSLGTAAPRPPPGPSEATPSLGRVAIATAALPQRALRRPRKDTPRRAVRLPGRAAELRETEEEIREEEEDEEEEGREEEEG